MNLRGCNKATQLCPCGYYGDAITSCTCTPDQIQRYQSRLSGPFLDRIDLHLMMQREHPIDGVFADKAGNESSEAVRLRVEAARQCQLDRQQASNAVLESDALRRHSKLDAAARCLMQQAGERLNLSLRAQHRMLRVARTIADLDTSEAISKAHLMESLSYRRASSV